MVVGRRARGSRLSRLAGISVILVLAGGGVAAYLVTEHPTHAHRAAPLPTTVISNQTIGLVAQDSRPGSSQLLQLRGTAGVPQFSVVTHAEQQAGSGQWTADQMGDNTYIFIFVPAGTCLTATSPATLALQRCDLRSHQRWRRAGQASLVEGHDFYEYANLSSGSCLAQTGELPGQVWGAGLSPCSPSAPTNQLIAFWWATA
jgi:hypothetical protein